MRVTVGTIVGLVASGHSRKEILRLYPYLEADDISEVPSYAPWREAWNLYQPYLAAPHVVFLSEPPDFEACLERLTSSPSFVHSL